MACSGCLDERIRWVDGDWLGEGGPWWELVGSGYEADSIPILFCPFCGVKLDEWNRIWSGWTRSQP